MDLALKEVKELADKLVSTYAEFAHLHYWMVQVFDITIWEKCIRDHQFLIRAEAAEKEAPTLTIQQAHLLAASVLALKRLDPLRKRQSTYSIHSEARPCYSSF